MPVILAQNQYEVYIYVNYIMPYQPRKAFAGVWHVTLTRRDRDLRVSFPVPLVLNAKECGWEGSES